MENSDPLVWYGLAVIFVMGGFILIPYLRGKSDLPTGWNILLLGIISYTGGGCLDVRYGNFSWPQLQWFQPTRQEVEYYMFLTTAFIVALLLCYYFNPFTRVITTRSFKKWPPTSTAMMLFVLVFCWVIATTSLVARDVFFVGLVLSQLSHKALVFACVFSFMLWFRNRINLFWLGLFIAVFIWAIVLSMVMYSGRRLLLSIFLVPVLCTYWTHLRYWKPVRCMSVLAAAAAAIFVIGLIYNSIRFYGLTKSNPGDRTAQAMIEQIKTIGDRPWVENFMADKLHYFGQWSSHYALLTKRFKDNGQLVPKPFNSIVFFICYPIPRAAWPDKPDVIGKTLVRDIVGYSATNWGVGIAGHGAYEGGVLALAVYAMLMAFGVQLADDPLKSQPANPFLIALSASALPHLMMFARGDIGIVWIEFMECFLFAFILGILCRLIFGTQPNPSHAVPVPPGSYGFAAYQHAPAN